MPRSPYPKAVRAVTALLGIPVLLLGSLTASALSTATAAPAPQAPVMTVSYSSSHHDAMNCDPIRFGYTPAADALAKAG